MNATTSSAIDRPGALTGRPPPLRMLWITAAWATCFVAVRWGLRDALLWFAALRALLAGGALAGVAAVQPGLTATSEGLPQQHAAVHLSHMESR